MKPNRDSFVGAWGKETVLEVVLGMRCSIADAIVKLGKRCKSIAREFRSFPSEAFSDELGLTRSLLEIADLIEGAPVEEDGEPNWEWRDEQLVHRWFGLLDSDKPKRLREIVGEKAFLWLEERRYEIGTGFHPFELDVAASDPTLEHACRGCGKVEACCQIHYEVDDSLLGNFCTPCADEILGDTADPTPRFWCEAGV